MLQLKCCGWCECNYWSPPHQCGLIIIFTKFSMIKGHHNKRKTRWCGNFSHLAVSPYPNFGKLWSDFTVFLVAWIGPRSWNKWCKIPTLSRLASQISLFKSGCRMLCYYIIDVQLVDWGQKREIRKRRSDTDGYGRHKTRNSMVMEIIWKERSYIIQCKC